MVPLLPSFRKPLLSEPITNTLNTKYFSQWNDSKSHGLYTLQFISILSLLKSWCTTPAALFEKLFLPTGGVKMFRWLSLTCSAGHLRHFKRYRATAPIVRTDKGRARRGGAKATKKNNGTKNVANLRYFRAILHRNLDKLLLFWRLKIPKFEEREGDCG